MRARYGAAAACLSLLALTATPGAQRRVPQTPASARPVFGAAERFDVSPPLRNLPALPPQAGRIHEAPPFRRLVGPRSVDPIVQASPAPALLDAPSFSVEGVSNVNSVLPPDTNGDIGPNHYVQWVNLSFAIYSRGSGTTPPTLIYGPAAGNTLWTGFGGPCETTDNGDPVVRYDHLADRWVMSQLALPNSFFGILLSPFYQCIAVSMTPDPTGPYYRYQFKFDKLNDYPKFGVWPDAYYMTMNQYDAPALTFSGQGVVAFDRAAMLQGQPAGMVYFDLAPVDLHLGGMLPADLDGPPPPAGAPGYYMQVDDDAWGYAPDQLQLWRFHVDWSNPSASSFTHAASLATAPFDSDLCGYAENCIPQPGGTALDALADRLMYRLQYRNFGDHESLVVNHTVDVDGTDHAGIRWYEVRDPGGAPAIYQQGTYAPDGDNRWMGSTAMDANGNLAIGFSVSGSGTYPSIRYAGRLATDPPGTLAQGEADLVIGGGSQSHSSGRWGDYSMLTVDPVDDCTFWYTQEYYAASSEIGWQTRIAAFSFPSCSGPTSTLPRVTIAATTATAAEAGLVHGAFTVSRTGDTSAPLTVPYTAAGTATAGIDYAALPGTVTFPAGASTAAIDVTPIDDAFVEPDETVIVSLGAGADHVVGSPGTALVTIVSDDLPPDLVLAALTVPAVGGANAPITVTDMTQNQGSGPSPASGTGFYLSKDFVLDASDALLGTRQVAQLAPGESDSGNLSITIPENTATGRYYIIAKADAGNTVIETNDSNNTKWAAITIGPDLVISATSGPASASAGGAIAVADTTANKGGGGAGPSTTAFYLSINGSLDGTDVSLGTRSVPDLAAGGSSTATTTFTVPANTAPGSYHVIAVADSANAVVESIESDNTRVSASTTRIGADLVVSSLTSPPTGGAGATIVVSDTTANQGAGDAAASATAFYLSANLVLDGTDVRLGARSAPALAAGAASTASTSLAIPPDVAPGTYYVIASADANQQVAESLETNNTKTGLPIRIGPDLAQASTTAPSTGGAGGTIAVGDTAKNQGGGAAGASTTGIYISTTSVFSSSSATLLGTRAVPALAAGTVSTGSTTVTLPATLATGNYYVIAVADTNSAVAETNETNNAALGVLVRVGPDLTVSAASAPTSIAVGTSAVVNSTILNQGGGAAASSTTRFYLSANLALDASDILVGTRAVGALAAGQSDAGPATITVPSGTATGSYFLLIVADGDGAVAETFETNNVRTAALTIKSGS